MSRIDFTEIGPNGEMWFAEWAVRRNGDLGSVYLHFVTLDEAVRRQGILNGGNDRHWKTVPAIQVSRSRMFSGGIGWGTSTQQGKSP